MPAHPGPAFGGVTRGADFPETTARQRGPGPRASCPHVATHANAAEVGRAQTCGQDARAPRKRVAHNRAEGADCLGARASRPHVSTHTNAAEWGAPPRQRRGARKRAGRMPAVPGPAFGGVAHGADFPEATARQRGLGARASRPHVSTRTNAAERGAPPANAAPNRAGSA